MDAVLSWLDLPAAARPTFISLYMSDVDAAGHDFGPGSPEVAKAVAEVDGALGRLMQGLKARGLYDRVNIIVVSDHGMMSLTPPNVVILEDFFDKKDAARVVWGSQLTHVFPRAGREAALQQSLLNNKLPHARCYLKRAVPARYRYREHRRIGPVVCLADAGWRIFSRERYDADRRDNKFPPHPVGAHGYDNQLADMRAVFVARGPAFKRRAVVAPFDNVDIYNVMARVLQLTPARNDGDPDTARRLLR